MSNEGSIPSGRAPSGDLENQQLSDRATGQASGVWSGVGPKPLEIGDPVEVWWEGEWAGAKVCCSEGKVFWAMVEGAVVHTGPFARGGGVAWRWPGDADPDLTAGKHGNPPLPAIPEPKRCKGLVEFDHTWTCEAVLGTEQGEQCAHCQNLEAQIRAEDAAVEEGERRDAEQAIAMEQLLASHQGDARAVVAGVLRTMVAMGVVSAEEEHGVHASVTNTINQAFLHAKELEGVPLMMFWSLLADTATAERNFLRRAAVAAFRGCA